MSPLRAGEEAVGTDVLIPLVIVLALALFLTLTLVFMCLRRRLDKGPAIRPAKLYHQTDPASAKIILQTQQMKPGNGGLAGGGIYFATAPELTGHKAHKKGNDPEDRCAAGDRADGDEECLVVRRGHVRLGRHEIARQGRRRRRWRRW